MKALKEYIFETILGIILLALIVILAVPFWYGYQMQGSYESLIESMSEKTGYNFEVINYDKGWLSTQADLLIKNSQNEPAFYFRHQIVHGPIYLGLLFRGESPFVSMVLKGNILPVPETEYLLSQLFNNKDMLSVYAAIRLNDDAEIEVTFPDINKSVGSHQYRLKGIGFTLDYTSDLQRYLGEVKIEQLLLLQTSTVEISQMSLNFDQLIQAEQFSGDIVLSVDELKLIVNNQITGIKQLSSRIKNRKGANLLDLDFDANISTINTYNEQINSLALGLTLNSIYYNLFVEQLTKIINGDQEAIDWHVFAGLQLKPFSFFSEHGSFNGRLNLKTRTGNDVLDFYHRYELDMNLDVSSLLLRRFYEIVVNQWQLSAKPSVEFTTGLLKANFLEKNAHKYLVRMQSANDGYVINDLQVSYPDFERNLLNSIFLQ